SGRPAGALGQAPASGPTSAGALAGPFAATSPGKAPGRTAGQAPGQAPGQAAGKTPTSAPTDPFSGDYGTTTLASGQLGGITWQLTRVIKPGTDTEHTPFPCPKDQGSYLLHQDLYVVTPDGVRVGADVGDSLTCSTAQGEGTPWDHTPQFQLSPLVSARYAQIDTTDKEQSSPYGSLLVGIVDETRIAKVQLKFNDGRPTATAQLVKAPAPENGTYFYFALPDKDWNRGELPGKLEFFDAAGHPVQLPGWQTR
ncbi:MAG: hypothetical protein HOV87_18795, partial [Catenulispora sp.]|nr:hypothetical protein [Catenulispora sp.]